ncbi:uncharacterized protein LOC107264311 [Cephus cinctus]|uniref:nicotinamidase n=1 Tax=Cephus cinctus TaxID=211228 RepID=A0AAJ7FEK2_CEPCN|nr:uncharacterized protein LOC107264311 [Cephus cinctus]
MTLNREVWEDPEKLLHKFDSNEDAALDFEEFCILCGELFGAEEVEEHEYRIRDIFDILDSNGDGLLNEDEWGRCHKEWISVVLNPLSVLLVVDVQNDFIDGTMALRNCGKGEDGADVIEPINQLLKEVQWKKVVYSLDWHPETHIGFYDNLHMRELHPDSKVSKEDAKILDTVLFLEPQLEQRLWPRHCVMDTWGAQLHKELYIIPDSSQIRKGQNPDMETYSVFFDNNAINSTELLNILQEIGITDVYVCGLAYDVCVRATCMDGLRLGYRLAIIEDCCRGVDPDDVIEARKMISENGGLLTNSKEVPMLVSGEKRSLIMAQQGTWSLAKKWSACEKEAEKESKE